MPSMNLSQKQRDVMVAALTKAQDAASLIGSKNDADKSQQVENIISRVKDVIDQLNRLQPSPANAEAVTHDSEDTEDTQDATESKSMEVITTQASKSMTKVLKVVVFSIDK